MNTEADRIHAAIMNLPINGASELINRPESKQVRYKLGHRDARRAATEIAQWSIAKLERENAKLREACEAWLEFNRETKAENPCPDYALRANLRERAKRLSIAALAGEGERE